MPAIQFEQAATVPHSGVLALQALTARGPVKPGSRVLINGAGGCVGPFAIQLAKAFGAEVTGVDHTDRLELMRSVGADHVVDYTKSRTSLDRASASTSSWTSPQRAPSSRSGAS